MANPWRGEVALVINGERRLMRLTLGALAELEAAMGAGSLIDLATRFEDGRFAARDVLAILLAGLRACGWRGEAGDLANAEIEGGPAAAARAAARLLALAFAPPGESSS
ncbi:MAG: gene transfer agent family protein [Alphaproteobacteria bacterium]|nr:MAG: gene transfer agent family protein [Alphaproteobacteria bacterium]